MVATGLFPEIGVLKIKMTDNNPPKDRSISNETLPEDRQELIKLANSVDQSIEVKENTAAWVIITSIASAITIALAIFIFMDSNFAILLKAFIIAVALFWLYLLFNIIKSRQTPLLVIKPEGLETSVFKTPVPWDAILDFNDKASFIHKDLNMGAALIFHLDENYIPEINPKPRFQSTYYKKNQMYGDNVLVINGCGILNSDATIVLGQVADYRKAALARKKLQRME